MQSFRHVKTLRGLLPTPALPNIQGQGACTHARLSSRAGALQVGKVLVFQHNLLHQGSVVTSGVKYVMRTDLMFSRRREVVAAATADAGATRADAAPEALEPTVAPS